MLYCNKSTKELERGNHVAVDLPNPARAVN